MTVKASGRRRASSKGKGFREREGIKGRAGDQG
jgi:hypothetical protein